MLLSNGFKLQTDSSRLSDKCYPRLMNTNSIGRLAERLACEAYFGKDILIISTVFWLQR